MKYYTPSKAKHRINETKKTLVQYGCTFIEYMRDSCHRRDDIDLGETISTFEGDGIICGWNGSCNFDVYLIDEECIVNFHPNDIIKKEA